MQRRINFGSMLCERWAFVPDLPAGDYDVWVRGYGLVDSPKVKATPGKIVNLKAVAAPDKKTAAQYYPAQYWFSLLQVPPKNDFPGTGDSGNGISPTIKSQGVVEPLIVRRRSDGTYELIAGERRFRAAQRAGLATIPAVIRDSDDVRYNDEKGARRESRALQRSCPGVQANRAASGRCGGTPAYRGDRGRTAAAAELGSRH